MAPGQANPAHVGEPPACAQGCAYFLLEGGSKIDIKLEITEKDFNQFPIAAFNFK